LEHGNGTLWARWVSPIHSVLSDRRTSSLGMRAVVVEIATASGGGFVSLRQYCRGQVHRTVPPTEMQIIVANKKHRNVDLPPPTYKWKRQFFGHSCADAGRKA